MALRLCRRAERERGLMRELVSRAVCGLGRGRGKKGSRGCGMWEIDR